MAGEHGIRIAYNLYSCQFNDWIMELTSAGCQYWDCGTPGPGHHLPGRARIRRRRRRHRQGPRHQVPPQRRRTARAHHERVGNYIDILTDLLLVRRLEPWHANVKKRLVKSPRYYVRDSGILHRLLGINSYDELLSNPVLGKSWEGFAVENIFSILPGRTETYFYRTAAGAEVDLL